MIKKIIRNIIIIAGTILVLKLTTGCAATSNTTLHTKRKSAVRVVINAQSADHKNILLKIKTAIHNITSAMSKTKCAVEIHARGKACRVAITGSIQKDQADAIGVATLNILSMYYRDFIVTINDRVFRIGEGMKPDDGTV